MAQVIILVLDFSHVICCFADQNFTAPQAKDYLELLLQVIFHPYMGNKLDTILSIQFCFYKLIHLLGSIINTIKGGFVLHS